MTATLDKTDLMNLVGGISPNYDVMGYPVVSDCGEYTELHGWTWSLYGLSERSEQELWDLYQLCKNSWDHGQG